MTRPEHNVQPPIHLPLPAGWDDGGGIFLDDQRRAGEGMAGL
jgi:hypothetical protein